MPAPGGGREGGLGVHVGDTLVVDVPGGDIAGLPDEPGVTQDLGKVVRYLI